MTHSDREVRVHYHKSISSNNIKHGDSQKTFWIKCASFLENLSRNGNCGVNRIADQVDNSIWATLGNSFAKSLHNPSIDVEQIIPSHSRFPGNTSGDDHKVHAGQGILQLGLPQESPYLAPNFYVLLRASN